MNDSNETGKAYLVLSVRQLRRLALIAERRSRAAHPGYTSRERGNDCLVIQNVEINRDLAGNLQIGSLNLENALENALI